MKSVFLIFVFLTLSLVLKAQFQDSQTIDSVYSIESVENKKEELINDIISHAKEFLGTPYKYAGTSPLGFDCSGFIYYVLGDFGFKITRTSYGMAEFGETVKLAQVKPGDLLFFKGRNLNSKTVGHVALVVEHDEEGIKMIHASSSRGIVIDLFTNSSYYVPRFLKAKRLDYGVETD